MDVEGAFKKIKIVYSEYERLALGKFGTQTSAYWLQQAVQNYSACTIAIKLVDWHSVQIKGRIDRYRNPENGQFHADIFIASKLNYCWRRFVGVKEMCHLIIDTYDASVDYSCAGDPQTLNNMIGELISVNLDASTKYSEQYVSEMLAIHCAIEIMFPISHRIAAAKKIAENDPNTNIMSLANEYRMPKHYVEMSLRPFSMDFLGRIAAKVEQEL